MGWGFGSSPCRKGRTWIMGSRGATTVPTHQGRPHLGCDDAKCPHPHPQLGRSLPILLSLCRKHTGSRGFSSSPMWERNQLKISQSRLNGGQGGLCWRTLEMANSRKREQRLPSIPEATLSHTFIFNSWFGQIQTSFY